MFGVLFGITIGLIIGWNLPQPKWVKDLQNKVIENADDEL